MTLVIPGDSKRGRPALAAGAAEDHGLARYQHAIFRYYG